MLILLISLLVLVPVIWGYGAALSKLLGTENCSSFQLISGLAAVTIAWTITAFFLPLSFAVELLTVAGGLILFVRAFLIEKLHDFKVSSGFFLAALPVIFFSTFPPFILDHFGYFVPTIKWLSEFGIVRGISNLDLILGQTSLWHVAQAGFSHFTDPYLRLNSVVLLIYLLFIFERKSWIHLFFIPFLLFFVQSPTADLPVIVISLMILDEIFRTHPNFRILTLLSVFVFTLKPTVIWVPLLVLIYGLLHHKSWKFWIPASVILLIFIIKNLWTFGYPVFPVQFPDMGINWQPNQQILNTSAQLAAEKTFDEHFTFKTIKQFTPLDWFKNWLTIPGIKGIINILFLLTLITSIVFAFLKKKKIITITVISILVKSIMILWFSAQYRFFMEVFFAVAFLIFSAKVSRKISIGFYSSLIAVLVVFFVTPGLFTKVTPSFRVGQFIGKFCFNQFLEPQEYRYNQYGSYNIGALNFNVVQDYPFSFTTPLPAISPSFLLEYYDAGIFPQPYSADISDGFYWQNLTDHEKKQLGEIIRELKLRTD